MLTRNVNCPFRELIRAQKFLPARAIFGHHSILRIVAQEGLAKLRIAPAIASVVIGPVTRAHSVNDAFRDAGDMLPQSVDRLGFLDRVPFRDGVALPLECGLLYPGYRFLW